MLIALRNFKGYGIFFKNSFVLETFVGTLIPSPICLNTNFMMPLFLSFRDQWSSIKSMRIIEARKSFVGISKQCNPQFKYQNEQYRTVQI